MYFPAGENILILDDNVKFNSVSFSKGPNTVFDNLNITVPVSGRISLVGDEESSKLDQLKSLN